MGVRARVCTYMYICVHVYEEVGAKPMSSPTSDCRRLCSAESLFSICSFVDKGNNSEEYFGETTHCLREAAVP